MSAYAIWFTYKGVEHRLPVNPEEIRETTAMSVEKYNVLKLGEIAVPGSLNLREFMFEAEFPQAPTHYSIAANEFHDADYFLRLFKKVRESKEPILFTAAYLDAAELSVNETSNLKAYASNEAKDTSTYVLITELEITEKAGEEGDKYVSFKLLEYREFSKKSKVVEEITSFSTGVVKVKKKKATKESINPKSNGYHVVVAGDTLWSIAKKYYGDGSKCNIIFNANKDKVQKPALISTGWKLRLPTIDEFAKYSVPLPKTIKVEPVIKTYQGGASNSGRTHSSGGGGF